MASPDPPFIANFVAFLLVVALVYLFYYSWMLKKTGASLELPVPTTLDGRSPAGRRRIGARPGLYTDATFYIEPSPIPGQKIPFPSIYAAGREVSVSVVMAIRNKGHEILSILQKFTEHFTQVLGQGPGKFEILIVDNGSSDNTRELVVAFAADHEEVRLLHLPRFAPLTLASRIGCTAARGGLIWLYYLNDRVPISEFNNYFAELKRDDGGDGPQEVLVVGSWKPTKTDYSILRSTLNIILEYLTAVVIGYTDIDESAKSHSRTFLMTREAARIIWGSMHGTGHYYDLEALIIATKAEIDVRCVGLSSGDPWKYCTPSFDRFDQFLTALEAYVMHGSNMWTIQGRAAMRRRPFQEDDY
jgi:hypothetical protein